jgi:hypothetical protein
LRNARGPWVERAARLGLAAFAGYTLLSLILVGSQLLASGDRYVGSNDDPQIFIWSFGWAAHALAHGHNPLLTDAIWAPSGLNLAWVTTTPALGILFAPVTWLLGPVAAYNAAAILMPATAAWTMFLLCRSFTHRTWPSLFGGYLFGFSSYLFGHMTGELHLTSVFLLPLLGLVIVRHVRGELGGRQLMVQAGVLLGAELYLSTEIAFTLTLGLIGALIVAYPTLPAFRAQLRVTTLRLLGAYAVGGVVASPLLYYALRDFRSSGYQPPDQYLADLANLVIPNHFALVGAGWAAHIARHFPGNSSEQGSYIGLPLVLIGVVYASRALKSPVGRFLLGFFALATVASFGPHVNVVGRHVLPILTPFGHDTLPIPGVGSKHVPLFDNTLPIRFSLFASMAVAAAGALWLARPRATTTRYAAATIAAVALLPNPGAGVWSTRYTIPPFFTSSVYKGCLSPSDIVLPLPIGFGGQATLWQATDFNFRMAGGRLQTSPPSVFLHPPDIAQISVGYPPVANQTKLLRGYIATKGVTAAFVDLRSASTWAPALDAITPGHDIGGVRFYRLSGTAPGSCPA